MSDEDLRNLEFQLQLDENNQELAARVLQARRRFGLYPRLDDLEVKRILYFWETLYPDGEITEEESDAAEEQLAYTHGGDRLSWAIDMAEQYYCVRALAYSDNHDVEVSFDAFNWFESATDEEILDLAGCDWGGDYPADAVAEFFEESATKELFEYLKDSDSPPGFECHVNKSAAIKWLQINRPHLLAKLSESKKYRRNSDQSIRELEQAYQIEPTTENGVRWVQAKLRDGQLPPLFVEIASSLGHPVAREILPGTPLKDWRNYTTAHNIAHTLLIGNMIIGNKMVGGGNRKIVDQLATDFAERVLPVWEKYSPNDTRPRRALEKARIFNEAYGHLSLDDERFTDFELFSELYTAADEAEAAARTAEQNTLLPAGFRAVSAAYATAYGAYPNRKHNSYFADAAHSAAQATVDRLMFRDYRGRVLEESLQTSLEIPEAEFQWQANHVAETLLGLVTGVKRATYRCNPDETIRELEQQYQIEPSIENATSWVQARLNSGLLPTFFVEIASRIGHPVAQAIMPEFPTLDWKTLSPNVFKRLAANGYHRLIVILAADFAERVLPLVEQSYPEDRHPHQAIQAARQWVADPTNANAVRAEEAGESAFNMVDGSPIFGVVHYAAAKAAFAAKCAHYSNFPATAPGFVVNQQSPSWPGADYHAIHASSIAADADWSNSKEDRHNEYRWQGQHVAEVLLGLSPTYQRNPDEEYRKLEQKFQISKDPEIRQQMRRISLRHGKTYDSDFLCCGLPMEIIPSFWAGSRQCEDCQKAIKVCCGERMSVYGSWPEVIISCRICGYEKDFG